jgi:tRNA pseudouridine55 synthase
VFALDKPVGPTAAQALARLRAHDPALATVPLGHAGRLDPMAEGLLTVLVGDETRQVHALRGQDKTYTLDVLLGLGSDSFDALGLVTDPAPVAVHEAAWVAAGLARVGPYVQRYPPFSQAKVGGRSLLALSHAGVAVERPTAPRVLHAMVWQGLATLTLAEASAHACARIARVEGPFRQEAITARWQTLAQARPDAQLAVASWTVRCSAGTYMRTLAHDLGVDVGLPAMAWRIRRTAAGVLTLDGARTLPP